MPGAWAAWAERSGAGEHEVHAWLTGAKSAEVSGPFATRASAERFAAGLASSGRASRVAIVPRKVTP